MKILRRVFNSKKYLQIILLAILIFLSINLILNDYQHIKKKTYEVNDIVIGTVIEPEISKESAFTELMRIKNAFSKILPQDPIQPNFCPEVPPKLNTQIKIEPIPDNFTALDLDIKSFNFSNGLQNGGKWSPENCRARHKVAIVIPYKDRLHNLNYFMNHMHPFLQRQELEYQIFVVEQMNDDLFNKGVLMNSAFLEIRNIYNYTNPDLNSFPFDCIIYHDVDLLPEDDRILYSCPSAKPRHLSVAIDKFKYKIFYYRLIGGVLNFKIYHFVKANGYSNEYWGWGGEDDDMEVRLTNLKIGYERPNINIAHYSMLKHEKRVKNPLRGQLLKKARTRLQKDGLNNVNYTLIEIKKYPMFTHIMIDVGRTPIELIQVLNPQQKTTTINQSNVTTINSNSTKPNN
ncbi:unnamed protein product [Brachionus calyciflorus]|uniref:Beta-1,4-galactosyltransferase n=1 Tax=Brachionus calyciflorus TaxID=104777 RepID=A0A813U0Q6_9BILA|nr:unnamed protein product [Brachionus calyciflorus]